MADASAQAPARPADAGRAEDSVDENPSAIIDENPSASFEENPCAGLSAADGGDASAIGENHCAAMSASGMRGSSPSDVGRADSGSAGEGMLQCGAEMSSRGPGLRLMSLLCLVGGLEGADGVLLPCSFLALQLDLGLELNDLALMSMTQALAGNLASPFWGVLADRGMLRRKTIISVGCVAQGLITVILAGVDALWLMVALRALNGVMLASLRPIAHGIVADVTSDTNRGKVYGGMHIAMSVGTMLGSLIGTNMARKQILGTQGWRLAFAFVGTASVLVGVIAWLFMPEPPRCVAKVRAEGRGFGAVKAELRELLSYFRLPSFCVLIVQGCFGTVPWNALGYKTMFFQLGGIQDFQASLIDVFSHIAGSLGGLLGGTIGDGLTLFSKGHGRAITAQISVLAGIPVAWFVFMARPPEDSAFAYYLILMIVLGLTATWCGSGVNLPILSEIVEGDRRATIMAWQGTLESSCSCVFGNAMVGILAQNVFGFDLSRAKEVDLKDNHDEVRALGTALMLVSFFPWMLCFACYSFLHWSYPRDLRRVQLLKEAHIVDAKRVQEIVA